MNVYIFSQHKWCLLWCHCFYLSQSVLQQHLLYAYQFSDILILNTSVTLQIIMLILFYAFNYYTLIRYSCLYLVVSMLIYQSEITLISLFFYFDNHTNVDPSLYWHLSMWWHSYCFFKSIFDHNIINCASLFVSKFFSQFHTFMLE